MGVDKSGIILRTTFFLLPAFLRRCGQSSVFGTYLVVETECVFYVLLVLYLGHQIMELLGEVCIVAEVQMAPQTQQVHRQSSGVYVVQDALLSF